MRFLISSDAPAEHCFGRIGVHRDRVRQVVDEARVSRVQDVVSPVDHGELVIVVQIRLRGKVGRQRILK